MEVRKCLECGEPLKGRADQKFCNDLCRNAYNNKKLGKASNYMRKINRLLKKNHAILKELNPEDKTTTYRSTLEKQGFSFQYYTNTYITRNGRVYYFVYDQGYSELENNKFVLVRKEDI
jgi:F0F1-type ATP synthase delta subunit